MIPDSAGGRWLHGPAGNEGEGAGSGIRCVCALYLVSRVCAGAGAVSGVMCGSWWRRGDVLNAQVGELFGRGSLQLQELWVCLLEAVEGSEEAPVDARHVLFCEVGVVTGRGVWAPPQQRHEAGCHHGAVGARARPLVGLWGRMVA